MPKIVVFHAGEEKIKQFRPCAHVGTRQAALERLGGASGFLHECTLSAPQHMIELEDWGANTGPALFTALVDYFERQGNELKQGFFDGARALFNHAKAQGAPLDKAVQESFLTGQLMFRGIPVISYRNSVEDAGSYSYFVLDPGLLKIESITAV